MAAPLLVAKTQNAELVLLPALANRHGLIAGATGTGKSVTLQALAQGFSLDRRAGVHGRREGRPRRACAKAGGGNAKIAERAKSLKLELAYAACPVVFWDVFGKSGHPVRATVSDMGPLLLARMLDLNDTQEGVLNLVFRIADDHGLLLLDSKDLRAMLQHVGDNAAQFTTEYGNVSAASIGAIQRGLLALENQGAAQFFGEPMLDIADLMQTDGRQGRGQHPRRRPADEFAQALRHASCCGCCPSCSSTCPRSATCDKPKLVFFFDEAHLLFNEAPKALLRQDRAGGAPDPLQGRGRLFRHAEPARHPRHGARPARQPRAARAARLHAARPEGGQVGRRDHAARTRGSRWSRSSPNSRWAKRWSRCLTTKGRPCVVERAYRGAARQPHRADLRGRAQAGASQSSTIYGHYEKTVDRESAYEKLKGRTEEKHEEKLEGKTGVEAC